MKIISLAALIAPGALAQGALAGGQKPSCTYVDHSSGYRGRGCGEWTAFCESRELVELAKELVFKCQHTCKFSKYLEDVCVLSSVPTVSPTAAPTVPPTASPTTKFPTVPPTDAPSRRPHVESGRSNEHHPDDHTGEHIETHTDEYLEANFDCYYKNCQEWDCAMWCKCFEQETEDADLYAESGCEDDGDNSCECVENVLGLHESEENWNFFGDSQAKPDQIKHHYNNIVVGTGVENYAETVKTFKRPFILDVWMKQDLDQNMDHYQDYPGAGNVFVFPQNKGGECSGYCMGINHQLASQTIEDLDVTDWTNNDYFYFAGGGKSTYQERKSKLNGNQTSINEHELWQKLTMKFTLDGHVSYYFNAEKNPRFEDLDTTYMEGSIRLGMNAANYRYHSPQITKGARDASVNIAPWRRLGSDYEEYWGEVYRTQWD